MKINEIISKLSLKEFWYYFENVKTFIFVFTFSHIH